MADFDDELVLAQLEQAAPLGGSIPFDEIACGELLSRLADPLGILACIRARLSPEGVITAKIRNVSHRGVVRSLLAGEGLRPRGPLPGVPLRHFTPREVEKLLFRTGFSVTRLQAAGEDWETWRQRGRPPNASAGPLTINAGGPSDAERFHAEEYLVEAAVAPKPDFGVTSVVVVGAGGEGSGETRRCVRSVRDFTDERFELIVVAPEGYGVSAGSGPKEPAVTAIGYPAESGVVEAINTAASAARGRQILLMSSTVIPTSGWLTRLLRALHRVADAGLAGPCCNGTMGPQQACTPYTLESLDGAAWEWSKASEGG